MASKTKVCPRHYIALYLKLQQNWYSPTHIHSHDEHLTTAYP